MSKPETLDPDYLPTLLRYYEEEIAGETYFRELGSYFQSPSVRDKFVLLSKVERHAASMVEPLLTKYQLVPRSSSELQTLGRASVGRHQDYRWDEFIAYIVKRYPLYMDDFHGLENMAPNVDRPFLEALSAHEVAAIEFANRELVGDPQSCVPLTDYLLTSIPSP